MVRWTGTAWENVGSGTTVTRGTAQRIVCCPSMKAHGHVDIAIPADGNPIVVYLTSDNKAMAKRLTASGWTDFGVDANGIAHSAGNNARIARSPIDGTP